MLLRKAGELQGFLGTQCGLGDIEHLALVLIAAGAGYFVTNWLQGMFPKLSIPMFSVGMLCGVVLQQILKLFKLNKYVDREVVSRIGSSVTDYLVGFGVATIKLSVVVKYAVPLLVLSLIGTIFVFMYTKRRGVPACHEWTSL